MSYQVHHGDALEVTRDYPDNHFDGLFCDPPYGISFMGQARDHNVPSMEVWTEVLRVLKLGAFGLVFGGTRTWHRLTCALEDAGFEIRDTLMWIYGSGFPKSYDISKGIDKAAGAEREVIGRTRRDAGSKSDHPFEQSRELEYDVTVPATPEAKRWQGYGTALKPSWEPVLLIRKPLDGNNVQNVLKHGCGGLNIDGTRLPTKDRTFSKHDGTFSIGYGGSKVPFESGGHPQGRWPANLILDEESAVMLDAQSGELYGAGNIQSKRLEGGGKTSMFQLGAACPGIPYDRGGYPSRFFYCAKVSPSERNAGLEGFEEVSYSMSGNDSSRKGDIGLNRLHTVRNTHPTLKPLDLCRYLATLILPPEREGDTRKLLVPFAGSGSEMIGAY